MPSPDDILYGASVDDKTGDFFDRFERRVTESGQIASKGFQMAESGIGKFGAAVGVVGGIVGGVVGSITTMIGTRLLDSVGAAVASVRSLATESAMLAARNETLGVSMEIVGANAGYNVEQLKEYEEGLKTTGISILEAKQGLVSMMQADLDLADAAKLARVAQDAAVLAGLNSSQTFQRILRGITTLQPEILRGLNLEVNMQEAVEEYARANNVAASSIDYATKKQIAMNAVLEKGKTIAGSYEAAMTTVGKKLGSLERYKEDFKVLFGEMFLPAFGAGVDYITKKLKEMQEWIIENKDSLTTFGEALKVVVEASLKLLDSLISTLKSIPGLIVDISSNIAQSIANSDTSIGELIPDISDSELQKRKDKIGQYFGEVISIAAGGLAYIGVFLGEVIDTVVSVSKASAKAISGDMEGANDIIAEAFDRFLNTPERAKEAFGKAVLATGEFVGVVKDAGDAADKTGLDIQELAGAAAEFATAMTQATSMLQDFARSMQEDMADQALKAARAAQEAAMREAWELEDLARQHAERVAAIMESAAQSRRDAMERHSQERISIEIDLQRQLRDIRRRFEFEATELARGRDAVGLLQLIRRNKQEIDDAKIAAQDRRDDSDRQYQLELRQIDARRRKALQDLARQEAREAEVRARARAREQALQALHRQWEEEDRRRKYARQLADLLRQIGSMSGMTQSGLNILTTQWSNYFGNLLTMAYTYMAAINRAVVPGGMLTGHPDFPNVQTGTPTGHPDFPVIGQAGLVSQMLADTGGRFKEYGVSRVPAVNTQKSTDHKKIDVHVDGSGLDPYIQRVVARTLFEIERNRG